MIFNDATHLRFYDRDVETPPVSFRALDITCFELMRFARRIDEECFGASWSTDGSVTFVAAPRSGCLEFLILPTFDGVSLSDSFGSIDIGKTVKTAAEYAVTLWAVIFGQRCLMDFVIGRLKCRPEQAEPAPIPGSALEIAMGVRAAHDKKVIAAVKDLAKTLNGLGFDKITIQIPDGPELPLLDEAINYALDIDVPAGPLPIKIGDPFVGHIGRAPPFGFQVEVNGRKDTVFVSETAYGLLAILMGSDRFIAHDNGRIDVNGSFVPEPQISGSAEFNALRQRIKGYVRVSHYSVTTPKFPQG